MNSPNINPIHIRLCRFFEPNVSARAHHVNKYKSCDKQQKHEGGNRNQYFYPEFHAERTKEIKEFVLRFLSRNHEPTRTGSQKRCADQKFIHAVIRAYQSAQKQENSSGVDKKVAVFFEEFHKFMTQENYALLDFLISATAATNCNAQSTRYPIRCSGVLMAANK